MSIEVHHFPNRQEMSFAESKEYWQRRIDSALSALINAQNNFQAHQINADGGQPGNEWKALLTADLLKRASSISEKILLQAQEIFGQSYQLTDISNPLQEEVNIPVFTREIEKAEKFFQEVVAKDIKDTAREMEDQSYQPENFFAKAQAIQKLTGEHNALGVPFNEDKKYEDNLLSDVDVTCDVAGHAARVQVSHYQNNKSIVFKVGMGKELGAILKGLRRR